MKSSPWNTKITPEILLANPQHPALSRTRLDMIEAGGRLCQILGLPRSTGQIYGLLYLSPEPLSLDDMVALLGISKASASNGTRQLSSWRAIRQIWVQGERKAYFEAIADLAALIHGGYEDFVKPRLSSSQGRINRMLDSLHEEFTEGTIPRPHYQLCRERLHELSRLQKRIQAILPLAEKLF